MTSIEVINKSGERIEEIEIPIICLRLQVVPVLSRM